MGKKIFEITFEITVATISGWIKDSLKEETLVLCADAIDWAIVKRFPRQPYLEMIVDELHKLIKKRKKELGIFDPVS